MSMRPYAETAFMKKWTLSLLVLILYIYDVSGQNISIGSWRTHFSYSNARLLTASSTKVFCATQNGFFSIDINDMSLSKVSKIDGLSGAGISAMQYADNSKVLVIGYRSGLIDLVYDNQIFSIYDIRDLRETFDKEIYDIEIYNGFVYAATNIGVLVISLKENAITDNYQSIGEGATDISVFDLYQTNGLLYAITSDGIQFGDLSKNLLDFNNWTRLNIEASHSYRSIVSNEESIYIVQNDTLLSKIVSDTIETVVNIGSNIKKIKEVDGSINILTKTTLYELKSGSLENIKEFSQTHQLNDFYNGSQLWLADGILGLIDEQGVSIIPNGPLSDNITNIKMVDEKLYVFYGPQPSIFDGSYDSLGYDLFENAAWTYEEIDEFYNIIDVESFSGNTYFASVGMGLYDKNDQSIIDETNSLLNQNLSGNGVLIGAIKANRSLWAISYDNNNPLIQLTVDNEWLVYDASEVGSTTPVSLDVSEGETLWIANQEGNASMININNEESRYLTTSSGLPSSIVNDMSLDVNDEAWVATTQGIANFSEATFISSDLTGSELIYNNEVIYSELNVSAVTSDGGGRVWVAGKDHLAVYSNNLTEQFFLFTEDNSPLPSTNIIEMEYNEKNGEIFILTDKGLISYRSNSSHENDSHNSVSIFPNPVRPGYSGLVGIKGVVSNADLKITDINGKLIQNVNAFGGTAAWDLHDYNNSRVQSGIYLIFSSDSEGTETFIGKIAVLH